jgi:uncharacterized Tic20 family protein
MTQDPDETPRPEERPRPAAPAPPPPPSWGEPGQYPPPPPSYGQQQPPPAPQYGQQPPPYGQPPPPQQPPYGQQPPPYGQPPAQPQQGQPPAPQYGQQPPPGHGQPSGGHGGPPYGTPPQQGPQGPYQTGGYQPRPAPPLSPAEEKQYALIAHLGIIVTGPIVPAIFYSIYKDRGPFVREQSREALNFGITAFIGYISAVILGGLLDWLPWTPPFSFILWIAVIVLAVMAAVAVNRGENYRYPFAIRFVND